MSTALDHDLERVLFVDVSEVDRDSGKFANQGQLAPERVDADGFEADEFFQVCEPHGIARQTTQLRQGSGLDPISTDTATTHMVCGSHMGVGEDKDLVLRVQRSFADQARAQKVLTEANARRRTAQDDMCRKNIRLVRDVLRLFNTDYRRDCSQASWRGPYIPRGVQQQWKAMCADTFGETAPSTFGTQDHGYLYRIVVRASYKWDPSVVDRKLRRLETCSRCCGSLETIASFFSQDEKPNCRGCSHNAADVALYPADEAEHTQDAMEVLRKIDAFPWATRIEAERHRADATEDNANGWLCTHATKALQHGRGVRRLKEDGRYEIKVGGAF